MMSRGLARKDEQIDWVSKLFTNEMFGRRREEIRGAFSDRQRSIDALVVPKPKEGAHRDLANVSQRTIYVESEVHRRPGSLTAAKFSGRLADRQILGFPRSYLNL